MSDDPDARTAPTESVESRIPPAWDPTGRDTADDPTVSFLCPRCGLQVDEAFYGPCTPCRSSLRSLIAAEAVEVEAVAYEPKMNVTPNAVALKDD